MAKRLAKKLAAMSEEERALFLEQQRLAEEEAQKKKEEMLSRFLKDKLSKEEQATKLNLVKLQEQWRNIMRRSKVEDLQHDIHVTRETFERIVDRKDAILRSLSQDIEEAEEQYQVALRSHIQNTDSLAEFQSTRITELEQGFQKDLDELKVEYDEERKMTIEQHELQMRNLRDVMYAMELRFNERETEALQEFQGLVDDLKNKSLEETHALKAQRKAVLDVLWEELQKETKLYKQSTEEKKVRFEALKTKDELSAKEIAHQMKRLKKLQDNIAELKAKMSSNAKESEAQKATIREDRETVLEYFRELKAEMVKSRELESELSSLALVVIHRANLTKLTLQSDAAIKELTRLKEKGEKILRLAGMCRKLETEAEKVLPFYSSSLSEEEEAQASSVQTEPPSENLAMVMHKYTGVEAFWKRYNKVLLDKHSLEKERKTLESENQKLRMLLKQYLDGISVSDEVLTHTNPLLVVSSKKHPNLPPIPVGDPRVQRVQPALVTVVEAAHVVKNMI